MIEKGEPIQLLPDASELGELPDAQKAFELAVKIEPKSVDALLELAHFNSAVLVEALESEKRFNQAIEGCFEFLEGRIAVKSKA